jgi:hypothetical protein
VRPAAVGRHADRRDLAGEDLDAVGLDKGVDGEGAAAWRWQSRQWQQWTNIGPVVSR